MSYSSRAYRHRNAHTHENDNDNDQSAFFSKGDKKSAGGKKGNAFFQAKLNVNAPGDKFEKEADSVASAVVNNSGSSPMVQQKEISGIQRLATSAVDEKAGTDEERQKKDKEVQTKPLQLKCAECEKEEKENGNVQTKSESGGGSTASAHLSSRITDSAGSGNALPAKTLNEMQTSFGTSFNDVNIHTDSASAEMNQELGAQAFTHGNDIYFNEGKFNPESSSGKQLLAHELTHVVQQGGSK
jgi:hypothetical protein